MIGSMEVLPSGDLLNSMLDIKEEIAKVKKGSKMLLRDAIQAAHHARVIGGGGTCAADGTNADMDTYI